MNFWLKHTDTDKFMLPVTPSSFEVQVAQKNTVVDVVSMGELNLLGNSGLRSVSLSCFFPSQAYNFSRPDIHEAGYYVDKIEQWRTSKTVVRLVIPNCLNMECSIESFNWGIKDGTTDIYYTINLKEYKNTSNVSKLSSGSLSTATNSSKVVNKGKTRTTRQIKATTHKVKKGDTLWAIAKKYYGKTGSTYVNKIYNANKNTIKSKNLIYVGQVLTIPK